jgi:hypothetical protein
MTANGSLIGVIDAVPGQRAKCGCVGVAGFSWFRHLLFLETSSLAHPTAADGGGDDDDCAGDGGDDDCAGDGGVPPAVPACPGGCPPAADGGDDDGDDDDCAGDGGDDDCAGDGGVPRLPPAVPACPGGCPPAADGGENCRTL